MSLIEHRFGKVPDQVWGAMESLPEWNGRRNDALGLSSWWAQRARAAEEQLAGAVEACLAQWVIAHGVKCGCENPDTAGCDWPVPVPHTQAALDAAIGGSSR